MHEKVALLQGHDEQLQKQATNTAMRVTDESVHIEEAAFLR